MTTDSKLLTAEAPVSVFLVDDHRSVIDAIALAIGLHPRLQLAGMATSIEEAMDSILETRPDVLIMDIGLPGADGIEGTRRIKELLPETAVLVFTGLSDPELLLRAIDAGASGFMRKEQSLTALLDAIKTVSRGDQLVVTWTAMASALELARARRAEANTAPAHRGGLTARELEVLDLLAEGTPLAAVARSLALSVHTCRDHVKSILLKLDAHSRMEAVAVARRAGLLSSA